MEPTVIWILILASTTPTVLGTTMDEKQARDMNAFAQSQGLNAVLTRHEPGVFAIPTLTWPKA